MINYYNPLIACLGTRFKKSKGATIGSPPTSSKKTNRTSSWQMMFMLMIAVFSGSMFAQTITIGAGASTSAVNANGNPIYRSSAGSAFNFSQSVHLLTAANLTAAGITTAKDITSMAFFKSSANTLSTGRTATLKIYMKSSTATTLGIESTFATWVSGATLVYSNTNVTPSALPSGAVTFPFSTPFQYYGTDGIEIAVDWSINSGTGSPTTGSFQWTFDATTNVQAVGTSNSAALSTALATAQSRRYKMSLTLANTSLPVCGSPAPGNVTGASAACAGVNFTLGLQNATAGLGVSYLWQSADNAGFTSGLATVGGNTPTLTTSLTSAKYYRCTVSCSYGSSSAIATALYVALNPPTQCYCVPKITYGCTDGDVIAKVALNTLSNDSGTGCPSGLVGYSDYTGNPLLTTTLQAGSSYNCTVSAGQYTENYAAWIDYNDDGTFGTNERIGFSAAPVTGSGIVGALGSSASFPIVLSCAPPVGVHRLRIRAWYDGTFTNGSLITPCGNNLYGEIEDYLVTITAADPCPKPTGLAITAASLSTTAATATWVQGCAETVWDAHIGAVGAGVPTGTISNPGLTSATATFSGLSASTNYEYYVRSVCDAGTSLFSGWSGPFAFRTQGIPSCATALVPANAATNVFISAPLSWTAPANTNPTISGYDVYFGTSPNPSIVSTNQSGTTYTPTTYDVNTTYYWKVVAKNALGAAVDCTEQSFTTQPVCTPSTTLGCTDGDVIAKVVLNTLVNDSGTGCPSELAGYSDYTGNSALTTTLQAGSTYNCTVSAGQYTENYAAWIDYDDNGVFDTSERIGFSVAPVTGSGIVNTLGSSASFPISLSCAPPTGTHRLRVRAWYDFTFTDGSLITPCGSNTYGEVEDYLITITAADPCPMPNNLSVTLATTTSATLGWKKGCVETEWDVHVQQAGGGVPVGTPSNPGVTTTSGANFGSLDVSGLMAGFAYEFYVRSVCDSASGLYSGWAGPFIFIKVAPGCTTLNSPANLATGVPIGTVPLSWSAPSVSASQSAATSYDVFFSTTPNPVTALGNTTGTTVNITNVTYGTYYVRIVPKNTTGSATGCVETSFTTVPAPPTVSDQTFCGSATVADLVAQGTSVQWYAASTGGAPLSSSTVLSNTTYYASQIVGGFESTRAGINVVISPLSVAGTVSLSSNSICPGNTATLRLLGSTGIVEWQYSLNGTTGWTPVLGTSSTVINTGAIPVTTYYKAVVTSGVCSSVTSNTVMLTVVIPAAPATAPQILPLTSTVDSLQATGSSIRWYNSFVGGPVLSSSTPLVSGNTYYASQTLNGCEGESRGASLVTLSGIPASKIRSTQCGSLLAAVSSLITADIVTGATMYRFQVTNGGTVNTLELNKYNFNLTQLPIAIAYGSTYSIKVAAKLGGNWGPYGISCNVTTPTISSSSSVPTTKMRVSQCGTTLATIGSPIHSELVYGAEAYRFQLTNGATVTEVESPIYYFFLTNTAIGTYGTTLSVKTKAKIGGIWGEYGIACSISTPALVINTVPTTQVRPSFCGTTLATLATKIPAVIVYNAEGYRFEITRAGVITVFDTTSYSPALAETGVIVSTGTVYAIRVAAKVNGVYGNYGVSCNVTTPVGSGNSKQIVENTDFSLVAYPNPSNSTFHLEVNGANDDAVSILVFDMMGRQIENKVIKSNDIENISLGQNYSTGVYNLIVSQGMNTKSVRLVKK